MKLKTMALYTGILLLLLTCAGQGQTGGTFRAALSVDRNEAEIGDILDIRLEVTAAPGYRITLSDDSRWDDLEILHEKSPVETVRSGKTVKIYQYDAAFYSTGDKVIGPLKIEFVKGENRLETKSNRFAVKVRSVLQPDGQEEIGDIRPVLPARIATSTYVMAGLFAVTSIFLIYHIIRRLKKRKRAPLSLSPEAEALAELEKLKKLSAGTPDQVKKLYHGFSLTLRRYIERRYRVKALDMTTAELTEALRQTPAPPAEILVPLRSFLLKCDEIRFSETPEAEGENTGDAETALSLFRSIEYREREEKNETSL